MRIIMMFIYGASDHFSEVTIPTALLMTLAFILMIVFSIYINKRKKDGK